MGCHKMLRPAIWWKFHQSCFRLSSQGKHFRMKENHTRSPIKMLKITRSPWRLRRQSVGAPKLFGISCIFVWAQETVQKQLGNVWPVWLCSISGKKYKYGNCVCTGVWLHLYGSFWVDGIAPYSAHSRIFVLAALSLQFWFLNRNS